MKAINKVLGVAVLGAGLFVFGCSKTPVSSWSLDNSAASAQLKRFIAALEVQAHTLAKQGWQKLPSDSGAFCRGPEMGDWRDATNLFGQMRNRLDDDSILPGSWWWATRPTGY